MNRTITKAHIAEHLMLNVRGEMTASETKRIVQFILDTMIHALTNRQAILLYKIGRIGHRAKGARPGRNPKTKQPCAIIPRIAVTMTANGNASIGKALNKTSLAEKLCDNSLYSVSDCQNIIHVFLVYLRGCLDSDYRIELRGFGVLYMRTFAEGRTTRNPKTGEKFTNTPASSKPAFKCSPCILQTLTKGLSNG
jgi:nucleoid DNA-binding protein